MAAGMACSLSEGAGGGKHRGNGGKPLDGVPDGGCGQTEVKQDNAITNSSEEGKEEGTAEEKELTGTIDEIKDFMFVVTDENDTPYSFTFEEKPEGLENVSNGDTVTVKYTGTISEVDPFEGEVLSVEKAK